MIFLLVAAGYVPRQPCSVVAAGAIVGVLLVVGVRVRALGKPGMLAVLGVAGVATVNQVVLDEAAGVRMLALIAATFVAMKIVVVAFGAADSNVLSVPQWLAFAGWFGMRPAVFGKKQTANVGHMTHGLFAIAGGVILLVAARLVAAAPLALPAKQIMVSVLALPALSLILHFGILDIVTALYRRRGFAVSEPFRNPLASRSLTEFWSRRWNIGFSEMIAVAVHRPLRRRAGETAALLASFLASGALHELAISLPVRAGYGLPTTYFLLHGLLVAYERRTARPLGRAWTLFWLAVPLPILFHPPFLRGVVWPLAGLG